jgi:hypothetical protein
MSSTSGAREAYQTGDGLDCERGDDGYGKQDKWNEVYFARWCLWREITKTYRVSL